MSATSHRQVTAAERRRQALELRRSGLSYQAIADAIGISKNAAWKAVSTALEHLAAETERDASTVRALELDRLDRLQFGLWRQATGGHHGAVDRILKIMERRARLLGIDAPQRIAPTDPTGTTPYSDPARTITDAERARRVRELLQRTEQGGAP